jgi:chitin synthase
MFVIMVMTWFSVGTFYTGYALVAEMLFCKEKPVNSNRITESCGLFMYIYIFVMGCNVLVSLATAPDNVKPFWVCLSWFFSAAGVYIIWGLVLIIYRSDIDVSDIAMYEAGGLFLIMGLAIVCYWENFFTMLVFGVHYILLTPTYINILTVFAICKTDDVSWGTRGKDEKGSSQQDDFNWKKTVFLAIFVACNVVMAGLVQ